MLGTAEVQPFQLSATSSGTWTLSVDLLSAGSPSLIFWWQIFAILSSTILLLQIQNNTENLYADKQQFHSLLYSPHQSHQYPRHKTAMNLCGVNF